MNSSPDFENCHKNQNQIEIPIQFDIFQYYPSKIIGYGSSSIVFKGRNQITDLPVAIKVIDTKKIGTSFQKLLIQNEKRVIERLKNKEMNGVSKYFQIVETKKQIYIVMEYYEGGDLEKVIKKGRSTEERIKKYLFQLLSAYIELYQLKIVHRDLKPANILIDGKGNLKIADFGFAVIQDQNSKKYNYCLGSPVYCSPESLEEFTYGNKSDIWALGVIVYKMVTNRTPWRGKNNKQLIQKMKTVSISSLLDQVVDSDLKAFIEGCCEVNLERRFGINELKEFKERLGNSISTQVVSCQAQNILGQAKKNKENSIKIK